MLDEVLVVDAASEDGTAARAAAAGASVRQEAELLPRQGPVLGKGDALWRALSVLEGEVVCFLDADTEDFQAHFASGLIGAVCCEPEVDFAKAFYRRPGRQRRGVIATAAGADRDGGGRVNRLMARPLLAEFFPALGWIRQPLAGEVAARRELLERLPFATGYGVEIAMLIDVFNAGRGRADGRRSISRSTATATSRWARWSRWRRRSWPRSPAACTRKAGWRRSPRGAGRAPAAGERRARVRGSAMRCLYLDLDGTLLGRGASLLHDGEGRVTIAGVRAVQACLRAGVEVVLMSGRRRAQVHEDARLLGQESYIYEAGACLVLDGEELWLTETMLPGELTIAEQIERSGAPQLLLEHYQGRLEYHEPWHVAREVSHLFRGLVDAVEADRLLAEHGHGDLRLVDNGAVSRRSPALAALPQVRGYHLLPGRRLEGEGGGGPPARPRLRAGGDLRRRGQPRGPRLCPGGGRLLAGRKRRSPATPRCAR